MHVTDWYARIVTNSVLIVDCSVKDAVGIPTTLHNMVYRMVKFGKGETPGNTRKSFEEHERREVTLYGEHYYEPVWTCTDWSDTSQSDDRTSSFTG